MFIFIISTAAIIVIPDTSVIQIIFVSPFTVLLLLFSTHWEFFTSVLADGFPLEFLSDSKSPQVSRTLLSILAGLNNTVVWTVSTRTVISNSSSFCTNSWVTVPTTSVTICKIVTFMFSSFFDSLARSRYLSHSSYSFNFTVVSWDSKVHNPECSLFFAAYY